MKSRVLVLTLGLCLTFGSVIQAAEPKPEMRQVVYELQIIELSKSDLTIMGVSFPEPEDLLDPLVKSFTRLIHSPGLIQILRTGAKILNVEAEQSTVQTAKIAQPQLTVVVGETGKISLSTETWLKDSANQTFREQNTSLSLQLTPLQIAHEVHGGEQIYTTLELRSSGRQELLSTVWTTGGVLEPLGVLSYGERTFQAGILKEQEKQEIRYFAVYLRAQLSCQLANESGIQVGSLGGLPRLLWPEESAKQHSTLEFVLPCKPLGKPEVELSLWVSERIKMGFNAASMYYVWELGAGVLNQELLLGGKLVSKESQIYALLGLTDRVQIHPSIALSAGVYPLVFSSTDQQVKKELNWWAELEIVEQKFYGRLKYSKELNSHTCLGDLGYNIKPLNTVFLRYQTDFGDARKLALGYKINF